jgi:HEPN domain-containing protein
MNLEKKEIIISWYEKADEDLLAAEVVIAASPLLYDISAFHSQQAAEKYIKAFLAFNEMMPPKVHNIKELIDIAASFNTSFEAIREAEWLSKYAIRTRYPDDFDIDTQEQALKILNVAKSVRDFVRNKIGF